MSEDLGEPLIRNPSSRPTRMINPRHRRVNEQPPIATSNEEANVNVPPRTAAGERPLAYQWTGARPLRGEEANVNMPPARAAIAGLRIPSTRHTANVDYRYVSDNLLNPNVGEVELLGLYYNKSGQLDSPLQKIPLRDSVRRLFLSKLATPSVVDGQVVSAMDKHQLLKFFAEQRHTRIRYLQDTGTPLNDEALVYDTLSNHTFPTMDITVNLSGTPAPEANRRQHSAVSPAGSTGSFGWQDVESRSMFESLLSRMTDNPSVSTESILGLTRWASGRLTLSVSQAEYDAIASFIVRKFADDGASESMDPENVVRLRDNVIGRHA